jgi:hypothetical protein
MPKGAAPDATAFATTLPPAEKPAPPPDAASAPASPPALDDTLDGPSAWGDAEPRTQRVQPVRPWTRGVLPTPPPAGRGEGGVRDVPASSAAEHGDSAADTLSPDMEPAARTLAPDVPPPSPTAPAAASLSSSTLAELYLRQGLTERAREVYRQVLSEDPANERARAGLRDLESGAAGPEAERAARRAALQRTIVALEAMLAAVRRD